MHLQLYISQLCKRLALAISIQFDKSSIVVGASEKEK